MHGDPKDHKGPTVFATHSTHKLLAALSQASLLHIRDGRSPIPHARFNESFMMHASTSPLYPIIVSNDVTAAMMDGPGRPRAHRRVDPGGGGLPPDDGPRAPPVRAEEGLVLQHLERGHGEGPARAARRSAFEDAPPELLATDPDCWVLHPGRQLARVRRPRRRLLHARPDQGVGRHAGRRRQGRPRQAGHPGDARDGLPPPPRRRGREDDRLHDPVPLLDRHHQGQVGHAAQRAARLQARLRPQRAARRGAAAPRRRVIPDTTAGLGLRDLADQMFAQLKDVAADALAGRGVLDAARRR